MRGNPYFTVCGYRVTSERLHERDTQLQAIVEVRIGHTCRRRAASGVGPVHALDNALRACLSEDFPELAGVRLSDYKVSVVEAQGTASCVKVLIEATDGRSRWDAGCVSRNVLDASFEALCSTSIMGIMRGRAQPPLTTIEA